MEQKLGNQNQILIYTISVQKKRGAREKLLLC